MPKAVYLMIRKKKKRRQSCARRNFISKEIRRCTNAYISYEEPEEINNSNICMPNARTAQLLEVEKDSHALDKLQIN